MHAGRVLNIPLGCPFIDTLAQHIWELYPDPWVRSRVRIYLPERRSVRALGSRLQGLSANRSCLLPQITCLSDITETFHKRALSNFGRHTLLFQLVEKRMRTQGVFSPTHIEHLSTTLLSLMDQMADEGVTSEKLETLVPEDFAQHWQVTLDFLTDVLEAWPRLLAEKGVVDSGEVNPLRQFQLCDLWAKEQVPVIIAGSTGTTRYVRQMMQQLLQYPGGTLILPGFLPGLKEGDIFPSHPQYTIYQLLEALDLQQKDVVVLRPQHLTSRSVAAENCVRSAYGIEQGECSDVSESRLPSLTHVTFKSSGDEALGVALFVKDKLHQDANTPVTLVVPSADLARRVTSELERLALQVQNPYGLSYRETPWGAFLYQLLNVCADPENPHALLILLKSPVFGGTFKRPLVQRWVQQFERFILRRLLCGQGASSYKNLINASAFSHRLAWGWAWIEKALAPLLNLQTQKVSLRTWAQAHAQVAHTLIARDAMGRSGGEMYHGLQNIFEEMDTTSTFVDPITQDCYALLFSNQLQHPTPQEPFDTNAPVSILKPLSARLIQRGVTVVMGLNEGVWPKESALSPWLSRPMRERIGIKTHEKSVGIMAHDFWQNLAADEILFTRSQKDRGQPTLASRFLRRLQGLSQRHVPTVINTPYLTAWVQEEKSVDSSRTLPLRPAPRPPADARPRNLYVTHIELLRRDPYAFYARHVLKLSPLEPIVRPLDGAFWGTCMHSLLEMFFKQNGYKLPLKDDFLACFRTLAKEVAQSFPPNHFVHIFWERYTTSVACWLWDNRQLAGSIITHEIPGALRLKTRLGTLTLRARADRIDQSEGEVALIDYKTGIVPSLKEVEAGYAPQLPLEALILAHGGFEGISASIPTRLEFWRMNLKESSITSVPPLGKEKTWDQALTHLERSVSHFLETYLDPNTPYVPRPIPKYAPRYPDYDHLERLTEWLNL